MEMMFHTAMFQLDKLQKLLAAVTCGRAYDAR